MMRLRNCLFVAIAVTGVAVAVGLVIQLFPTGVSYTNPPVVAEPPWDSARTRDLAARACFDCHSNETAWPWYARIAPMKWLMARHVKEGRAAMNFSEWGVAPTSGQEAEEGAEGEDHGEADDIVEEIQEVLDEGEMPPGSYLIPHPEARLSADEIEQLKAGLIASLK
jgi:hypothetical protein